MTSLAIEPRTFAFLTAFVVLACAIAGGVAVAFRAPLRALLASVRTSDPAIERPEARPIGHRVALAVLVATIACGALFRLAVLDRQIFWDDETWTAIRLGGNGDERIDRLFDGRTRTVARVEAILHERAASPVPVVETLARDEPQWPPAFYLALWAWSGLFGTTPVALRTLAGLFGVAAIPATYWVARELFRSRVAALAAAALVALSPAEIVYAREARGYSLLLLSIALSTGFLLRASRTPGRRWWIGFTASTIVGCYDYMLYLPVALGHVAFVCFTQRSLRSSPVRSVTIAAAIALAAYLPWLAALARGRTRLTVGLPQTDPHFSLPFYLGKSVLDIAMTFFAGTYYNLSLAPVAVVVALVAVGFALVTLRRLPRAALLLACVGLPPSIAQLPWDGLRHTHLVLIYRYDVALWFALQLAVAGGIAWTFARGDAFVKRASVAVAGGLCAASAWSATLAVEARTFWDGWYDAPAPAIAAIVDAMPHPVVVLDHDSDDIFSFASELRPDVRIRFAERGARYASAHEATSDVVVLTSEARAPAEWNGRELRAIYSFDRSTSLVVRLRQRYHDRALAYGSDPFVDGDTLWLAGKP